MIQRAQQTTAELWSELEQADRWVKQAVDILANADHAAGSTVRRRYQGLIKQIGQFTPTTEWLDKVIETFVKVTASYQPHLFHCYDIADLPRTNNDLEHLFGTARYHQRRITGRKAVPPSVVLYGPARLPAMIITPVKSFTAEQLVPTDMGQWYRLRESLEYRHQARVWGYRFRRNPDKYLTNIEEKLIKPSLPP